MDKMEDKLQHTHLQLLSENEVKLKSYNLDYILQWHVNKNAGYNHYILRYSQSSLYTINKKKTCKKHIWMFIQSGNYQ